MKTIHVILEGDAAVGKSALMSKLAQEFKAEGHTVECRLAMGLANLCVRSVGSRSESRFNEPRVIVITEVAHAPARPVLLDRWTSRAKTCGEKARRLAKKGDKEGAKRLRTVKRVWHAAARELFWR